MDKTMKLGAALAPAILLAGCVGAPAPYLPAVDVAASGQTAPVGTANEDAADDPAIWRNAADPSQSLVIGTDKKAGLYVYGLNGAVRSFQPAGLLNNVDLIGGQDAALVAASDRSDVASSRIALFSLRFDDAKLLPIGSVESGAGEAYGLCLAHDADGANANALPAALTAYAALKDGTVNRVDMRRSGEGQYAGTIAATAKIASQIEGCVVDRQTGDLYVGEENAGIWRFSSGDLSVPPEKFADIGAADGLVADVEGLAIAYDGDAKWLIASSQGDNAYTVFDMAGALVGRFRIAGGAIGATSETDGIEIVVGDFGPEYPGGLFVAQDGDNAPDAQNFKYVSWDAVKTALGL